MPFEKSVGDEPVGVEADAEVGASWVIALLGGAEIDGACGAFVALC